MNSSSGPIHVPPRGTDAMLSIARLALWYDARLESNPLLTKATTTAAIGVCGDAAAQLHEYRQLRDKAHRCYKGCNDGVRGTGRRFRYDARRGLANAANNFFLTAPIYHHGYDLLDALIPIAGNDSSVMMSALAALVQVLIDCAIFDALFVFLAFASSRIIEGYERNEHSKHGRRWSLLASMKSNLIPAIIASWRLTIYVVPVEYVLFRYFPLRLRVLGMNAIDLVWDAVVSLAIHRIRRDGEGGGGFVASDCTLAINADRLGSEQTTPPGCNKSKKS